jgi:hypothetical protein
MIHYDNLIESKSLGLNTIIVRDNSSNLCMDELSSLKKRKITSKSSNIKVTDSIPPQILIISPVRIDTLEDYQHLLVTITPEILVECYLYIHRLTGKLVQFDSNFNGKYSFYDYNDKYYYEDNCINIYGFHISMPVITLDTIPKSDFTLFFESCRNTYISPSLQKFQSNIQVSLFVSLYTKDKCGNLILNKNRTMLRDKTIEFNRYCETLPKSPTDFIVYRGEYRHDTTDLLYLIESQKEIVYHTPFSTSYDSEFANKWIGGKIIFVISVPKDCNYMKLQDDSQYEITLQQGTLVLGEKHKYIDENGEKYIIYCNFIPSRDTL